MNAGASTTYSATGLREVGVSNAGIVNEPVWRIIVRTVRQAPDSLKHTLWWGMAGLSVMVIVQIWDVWGRSGPRVVAELLGSLAGFTGGSLIIFARVLQQTTEHITQTTSDGGPRRTAPLPPEILLALPTVGFTAGTLIAFGIANYVLRGVLGTTPLFVIGVSIVLLVMLFLGARMVTGTTRFLYHHAYEQAQLAAQAESQAVQAQMTALQAQMNPHFLFNALNTVASLVRTDSRRAERTIESLADVLRRTMSRSAEPVHTLGEEIEFLEAYLAIEQERFGQRLRVEWAIPSEVRGLRLPPLTLQPLVENAVKHGLGSRLEGGTLRIAAERAAGGLRLIVEDDGEGFPTNHRERTGLGNLRKRLATLYGQRATLRIEKQERGTRVIVELPDDGS